MDNAFQRMVTEPLGGFLDRLSHFLPDLIGFFLIVILGVLIGLGVKFLSFRIFRRLRLDKYLEKWGFPAVHRKKGFREPFSRLLSKLIGWTIMLVFFLGALSHLHLPSAEQMLEGLILYLPNAIVAVIIASLGYFLGDFISRAVLIAAVNAGWKMSRIIARFVKVAVILIAFSMSLEQLGIGRETIHIAFAIVFGGLTLACALAFGLGAKDVARDYIERKMRGEQEKEDEIEHL